MEIIRTLLERRGVRVGLRAGDPADEKNEARNQVESLVQSERCEGYSGADLAALVREAGVIALKRTLGKLETMDGDGSTATANDTECPDQTSETKKEGIPTTIMVEVADFVGALEKMNPSVSLSQRKEYEALKNKFAGLPVRDRTRTNRPEEMPGEGRDDTVMGI